jgi:hypothetical protein
VKAAQLRQAAVDVQLSKTSRSALTGDAAISAVTKPAARADARVRMTSSSVSGSFVSPQLDVDRFHHPLYGDRRSPARLDDELG